MHGDAPLARGVDPPLASLIAACLEKSREKRIASMREVVARLRTVSRTTTAAQAPRMKHTRFGIAASVVVSLAVIAAIGFTAARHWRTAPELPSAVAVLPFDTPDARDSYLSSGFAEGLTTDLAKQSGLSVIARESATRFRASVDVRRTSAELGARYLILGNITRSGEGFRIDAQAVDGPSRAVVWAEKYDSTLGDIFAVQSRIARDIAGKLAPRSSLAAAAPTPHDAAVAETYLRAQFFASDRNWSVQDKSIPLLEQVCAVDPQFTPARVELAAQYARRAFARDPDRQWEQRAFVAAEKLLRDFPNESEPYRIRGNLRYTAGAGWRYDEALADFDRSISLDHNNAAAYNSRGSLFMHLGALDHALADFGRALKLDPFSEFAKYRIARIQMYQRKYDQAIAGWRANGRRSAELAVALDLTGHHDEALRVVGQPDEAVLNGDSDSALAVIYARAGDRERAMAAIKATVAKGEGSSHFHHAAYFIAAAYAQMRDPRNAVPWLERVSREGMPCYPLFANDVLLDPIRDSSELRTFLDGSRTDWERRRLARQARSG
jgi:TolB-like protein